MSLPHALVGVDEQLAWVVRVPESAAGTSVVRPRPSTSPRARAGFDALAAAR